MNRNIKIIIISASICLLIFIFYFFFYKGILILNPQVENSVVLIGDKTYDRFPQEIKFRKSNIFIRTKKDGYLDSSQYIQIKPFKTVNYEPELKKAKTLVTVNPKNFYDPVIKSQGSLYFFNLDEKEFQSIQTLLPNEDSDAIALSGKFDIEEGFDVSPTIKWSKDKQYASLISGNTKKIVNLSNNSSINAPKEIVSVDFTDKKIVYLSNKNVFKSNIDFSSPEKVMELDFDAKNSSVSPSGKRIAFWNDSKLAIYNLDNINKEKSFNYKINKLEWQSDNQFAFVYEKDADNVLSYFNTDKSQEKSLGAISRNEFAWKDSKSVFFVEYEKGIESLVLYNFNSNKKEVVFSLAKDRITNLLLNYNGLVFLLNNILYSIDIK